MFWKKNKEETKVEQKVTSDSVRTIPEIITICHSDMGNRKYQQDRVYVSPGKKLAANKTNRFLATVCDGMGGMTDGAKASQIAVESLVNGFKQIEKAPNVSIPEFFAAAVSNIDRMVCALPKENGKGSGTTMVAVILEDNNMYYANVGDSRIYMIRNHQITQLTRDHNYMLRLKEYVNQGKMTMEEAEGKKQKEALISFLGIGSDKIIADIPNKPTPLKYGDVVLLCSDGITKTLPDDQILSIITNESKSMQEKAEILVGAALRGNMRTQDNTSVALLQYKESIISRTKGGSL